MNHFTPNSTGIEIYPKARKMPNADAVSVTILRMKDDKQATDKHATQKEYSDQNR